MTVDSRQNQPIKLQLGRGRSTPRRFSFHRTVTHHRNLNSISSPQKFQNTSTSKQTEAIRTQSEKPPPQNLVNPVLPTTATLLRWKVPAPVEEVAPARRNRGLHLLPARPICSHNKLNLHDAGNGIRPAEQ